jgi:hypothetical protein
LNNAYAISFSLREFDASESTITQPMFRLSHFASLVFVIMVLAPHQNLIVGNQFYAHIFDSIRGFPCNIPQPKSRANPPGHPREYQTGTPNFLISFNADS